MDIATLVGLISGIGLIIWAMTSRVSIDTFVDIPSVAIVIGGSVAASLISFPLRDLAGVAKVVKNAFFSRPHDLQKLIGDLVSYAEKARRDGILSLEDMTREMEDEFIVGGIQMVVDGTDPELIEQIMVNELDTMSERHAVGKALFDTIGRYAPAFGMIGTLIGLVVMLKNMDDPSALGPAMAVALLTQLYGVVLAMMSCSAAAIITHRTEDTRAVDEVSRQSVPVAAVASAVGVACVLVTFSLILAAMHS